MHSTTTAAASAPLSSMKPATVMVSHDTQSAQHSIQPPVVQAKRTQKRKSTIKSKPARAANPEAHHDVHPAGVAATAFAAATASAAAATAATVPSAATAASASPSAVVLHRVSHAVAPAAVAAAECTVPTNSTFTPLLQLLSGGAATAAGADLDQSIPLRITNPRAQFVSKHQQSSISTSKMPADFSTIGPGGMELEVHVERTADAVTYSFHSKGVVQRNSTKLAAVAPSCLSSGGGRATDLERMAYQIGRSGWVNGLLCRLGSTFALVELRYILQEVRTVCRKTLLIHPSRF